MPVACTNKTRSESEKKKQATLEFYQTDGPVKIRKKWVLKFTSHLCHACPV